ncbi:endocuticle structural glycoprotein SgAbd-1-like [Anoplophora glabripennis]|uniref:endocuticle structural glycoprotein SgAbd-1-like n=1 Tax=Anoplophora glabripennis TaxID=217634 RepID=UPI0008759F51|nr:endocuticle structural glycoprotein SgAbd-1-like [Anoplophora glabripennis]
MIKLVIAFTLMTAALAAITPTPPGKIIAILRSSSDIAPDGSSYKYDYETENGISVEESGSLAGNGPDAALTAVGSYKFTLPDGTPAEVAYIAGPDGFQPTGNIIPTPPPIPEAIQRALAYNEAHPEQDSSEPVGHKGFLLTSF